MKEYKNSYARQIHSILMPLIGDNMAASVIKTQAGKLGISDETIGSTHIPAMAQGIKMGLVIFIGSDAAKT